MSSWRSLTQRLDAVEQRTPPRSVPDVDPSARLTPDQMMRAAELVNRINTVGAEGLTEQERTDADEIRAALLASRGDQL